MILKPDIHLTWLLSLIFEEIINFSGNCILMFENDSKAWYTLGKIINFSGNCILMFENDSKAWYTFKIILKPNTHLKKL